LTYLLDPVNLLLFFGEGQAVSIKIKPLTCAVLSTMGLFVSQAAVAATSTADSASNSAAMQAQIKQLQAQTVVLQQQLVAVEQQLAKMQGQQATTTSTKQIKTTSHTVTTHETRHSTSTKQTQTAGSAQQTTYVVRNTNKKPAHIVTNYDQNILQPAADVKGSGIPYGEHSLINLGGFAVITSPYLHPNVSYDGGDFIVNYSSINRDINMLEQRQTFQHAMHDLGFVMPSYGSLLELSGEVQGSAFSQHGYGDHSSSNINLSDVELDMQALVNRWITAYGNFAYNDAPTSSGNRTFNSNVYVDNAFITLGNLDATKWRATVGQLYVPFGNYNSFLYTDPINKTIFRTEARPILVGWGLPSGPGFSAAAYTFAGNTRTGTIMPNPSGIGVVGDRSENDQINRFGLDSTYSFNLTSTTSANLGASYINNVADSLGMQSTGGNTFEGFSDTTGDQVLAHKVPGGDLRGQIAFSQLTFIGEYTTALRDFNRANLSFNGRGAKPSAYHLEGIYFFNMLDGKPTSFALGYDHSYQSLALNVPEQRIAAALNLAYWRNTMATLEFRHDMNYSSGDTASGNLSSVITPGGANSNAITAVFSVYF